MSFHPSTSPELINLIKDLKKKHKRSKRASLAYMSSPEEEDASLIAADLAASRECNKALEKVVTFRCRNLADVQAKSELFFLSDDLLDSVRDAPEGVVNLLFSFCCAQVEKASAE